MKVTLIFLTIFALAHLAESLDDLEGKHSMVGHSSDCENGQACFRFQSSRYYFYRFFLHFFQILFIHIIHKWSNLGNETSSEYANWSGLVHCDDESECQGIFGNSIPTQCSKIYSHSRNGICAPRNCQHNNTDCPIIGDECTSGAISGECNINSTQCDYAPVMMLAYCIPGKSLNSPANFIQIFFNNYRGR